MTPANQILPKTFWKKTYRAIQQHIVFENEKIFCQSTQKEIEIDQLTKQIEQLSVQIKIAPTKEERKQIMLDQFEIHEEMLEIQNSNIVFTKKCINPDCHGKMNAYASGKIHCGLCQWHMCGECEEHLESIHECDSEIVANIQQIKKTSKACPVCNIRIVRAEGCDQMFCTECFTLFDWKTLQVERGWRHNPNYHQWLNDNPDRAHEVNSKMPSDELDDSKRILEFNYVELWRGIVKIKTDFRKFITHKKLPTFLKSEERKMEFTRSFAAIYQIERLLLQTSSKYKFKSDSLTYDDQTFSAERKLYMYDSIDEEEFMKIITKKYMTIQNNRMFNKMFGEFYDHVCHMVNHAIDDFNIDEESYVMFTQLISHTQDLFIDAHNHFNTYLGQVMPIFFHSLGAELKYPWADEGDNKNVNINVGFGIQSLYMDIWGGKYEILTIR